MAKKRNKDEYMIRTLAYYQSQGGIFSDMITLIMQLRGKSVYRRIMPLPAKALNVACFIYDEMKDGNEDIVDTIDTTYATLLLCIIAVLASNESNQEVFANTMRKVDRDRMFFPHFKLLIKNAGNQDDISEDSSELSRLREENEMLNAKLQAEKNDKAELTSMLTMLSKEKDELNRAVETLQKHCQIAEQSKYDGTALDRYLTLDVILKWIDGRQHYNLVDQVFRMLTDMKDGIATNEERKKIREVEERMLAKESPNTIINQNYAYNSNMMTGLVSNPQLPIGMREEEIQRLLGEFLKSLNNGQQQGQ